MNIEVYVNKNSQAFGKIEIQEQFSEYCKNNREDILNDFIDNFISSSGRYFLFDSIISNDAISLAIVHEEFNNFLSEVEEKWINDNFTISTIEI